MDNGTILLPSCSLLEDFLSAWDQAAALGLAEDPENFLPTPDHPLYLSVLAAILCRKIDLDDARGVHTTPTQLANRFPILGQSRVHAELVFAACAKSAARPALVPSADDIPGYAIPEDDLPTRHDVGMPTPTVEADWPPVRSTFHGHHIVVLLGEGSFGRVYLTEQVDLSNRPVVLKLSRKLTKIEPRLMARLQHTNIVPIYSTFHADGFEVICMPWYGATTLNDLLHRLVGRREMPLSGAELVDTLMHSRHSTRSRAGAGSGSRNGNVGESLLESGTTERTGIPSGSGDSDAIKTLEQISHNDYVSAILMVGASLAEALSHAHHRGIIHRDIKPANILLTDDGLPMLLDFNLSDDLDSEPGGPRTGGTPAYMSPEQLALVRDRQGKVDHRVDIYALGLVLFELLGGRSPFPRRTGAANDIVPQMIEDRLAPIPSLSRLNPRVTPATRAIVEKCLAPDADRRYANADHLAQDLRRQLASLPLLYASNRSWAERARKFVRRNPIVTSTGTIAVVGLLLVAFLGSMVVARQNRVERLEVVAEQAKLRQEAVDSLASLGDETRRVQFVLTRRTDQSARIREAEAVADAAFARYGLNDGSWKSSPLVRWLNDTERAALVPLLEDMLFVRAHAAIRLHADDPAKVREAVAWHRLTLELDPRNATSPAWLEQNTRLSSLAGADAVAPRTEVARTGDELDPRDLFLLGRLRMVEGRPSLAIPLLKAATDRDPRSFWAWFLLANAFDEVGDYAQEDAAFQVCTAIWPDFVQTWVQRGLCRLNRRDYVGAREDFIRATELDGDNPDSWLNRAICESRLQRPKDGLASVAKALELGKRSNTVYLLRAQLHSLAGRLAESRQDLALAMSLEPKDEVDWADRGAALRKTDPKQALKCLDRALAIDPRYFRALQDRVWLMDTQFADLNGAIRGTDRLLQEYPGNLMVRASRGVYLARRSAQDRSAALEDARHCLSVSQEPSLLYRVAGIYALTGAHHPEDRRTALHLLTRAFQAGYGLDVQSRDTDLDGLRKSKEFQELIEAAGKLATLSKLEK